MARLARAMPRRPIITGFVPPQAPIIPPPFIIRSIAVADAKRRFRTLPKRARLPDPFNVPPSSPYLRITKAISTARRYQTLPKRAIVPNFVEPVKPTIIIRSTARDVARRSVVVRQPILPLPFNVPPSSPNVIKTIRIAVARARAMPRKPILFQPQVPPLPYIAPVVTYVIRSTAKDAARRQSGPRKRPFIFRPANPPAPYVPPASGFIVHLQAKQTARRYATKLLKALTTPFVPVHIGSPQKQNQFYWGRHARGQYLNIILNLIELPDAVPTVTFWKEGTTAVETLSMPRIRAATRTFRLVKLLDTDYDDGHYAAVMRVDIGGDVYTNVAYFEVIGGTGDAPKIAVSEIDRAAGRGVVSQDNAGNMTLAYKPKKLLP